MVLTRCPVAQAGRQARWSLSASSSVENRQLSPRVRAWQLQQAARTRGKDASEEAADGSLDSSHLQVPSPDCPETMTLHSLQHDGYANCVGQDPGQEEDGLIPGEEQSHP